VRKDGDIKDRVDHDMAHVAPKAKENMETQDNKFQSSRLSSLFKEVRYGLLQLFVGRKARVCVEKSLQEHKNLSRFNPANLLETLMAQPSDIWEHLATLHMLNVEFDLKTVLELGTAEGESTVALLQAAHQIDGRVYSIDINPCREAWNVITNFGLGDRWSFIQGDDLQVNWDKSIDHLFIDTSHTYEHTLKELQKYEPYVRIGGIITLHDTISFPEVMTAILDYIKNRGDLRVYNYLHNNGLAVIFKGKREVIKNIEI
jgi:predicted O-methyltransferase YrrM